MDATGPPESAPAGLCCTQEARLERWQLAVLTGARTLTLGGLLTR